MTRRTFSQQAPSWATSTCVTSFPRWEDDPVATGVHHSRPIPPVNRPVNALTRNAVGLPHPIIDTRNSAGKLAWGKHG